MNGFARYSIRYTQRQKAGLLLFVTVLFIVELGGLKSKYKQGNQFEIPSIEELKSIDSFSVGKNIQRFSYENFDPNKLDVEGWKSLGFSEKQTNTIIKYKRSLGGYFSSKEQLQNCFVISEKKFEEIEPYVIFGNLNEYEISTSQNYYAKQRIAYKKFNPNQYTQLDWQNLGFSEKQAGSILKYKMKLGGSFTSLDQIKKCYMINDEKFNEMKPYIVLNIPTTKSKENKSNPASIKIVEENESTQTVGTIVLLED